MMKASIAEAEEEDEEEISCSQSLFTFDTHPFLHPLLLATNNVA